MFGDINKYKDHRLSERSRLLRVEMGSPDQVMLRVKIQSGLYGNIEEFKWGNLREETEGINIILKQANKAIRKDKFSAFEYGLYYIKQEEDSKKKKKYRIADMMFLN